MKTRLAAIALLALSASPAAHACATIRVYNDSDHKIHAFWTAGGCGGVPKKNDELFFVCHSRWMEPRSGPDSYTFPWGKTAQAVTFVFNGVEHAEEEHVRLTYSYHKDHSPKYQQCGSSDGACGAAPIPSCGHHYSINVTNQKLIDLSLDYAMNEAAARATEERTHGSHNGHH